MNVQVLYFAGLKDQTRLSSEILEDVAPGCTVSELLAQLRTKHPTLVLGGVRAALNEEFTSPDAVLRAGDVVALIPPVSGG